MNRRHEERYKRAMERVSEAQEIAAMGRAMVQLGFAGSNYSNLMLCDRDRVDQLAAHKLGRRYQPS